MGKKKENTIVTEVFKETDIDKRKETLEDFLINIIRKSEESLNK